MIYYYTVDYILTGNVFTDTIADLLLHPYAESSYARHYTCKKKFAQRHKIYDFLQEDCPWNAEPHVLHLCAWRHCGPLKRQPLVLLK
jgi:hypothetical protein